MSHQCNFLIGVAVTCRPTTCESDEFYVATLLAHRGLAGQTTCQGSVVHDNWRLEDRGGGRNRSRYSLQEVTAAGIARLRGNRGRCQPLHLLKCARRFHMFPDSIPCGSMHELFG